MKPVTGAILILSAAVLLAAAALLQGCGTESLPLEVLLLSLSGLTGVIGAGYLILGSVVPGAGIRRFQFGVRTLLILTVCVAAFFSGVATGLKKSQSDMERLECENQSEDPVRAATRLGFQMSGLSINGQPVGRIDDQVRQAIRLHWVGLPKEKRNIDKVQDEVRRCVDRALDDLRQNAGGFLDGALRYLSRIRDRSEQVTYPTRRTR